MTAHTCLNGGSMNDWDPHCVACQRLKNDAVMQEHGWVQVEDGDGFVRYRRAPEVSDASR